MADVKETLVKEAIRRAEEESKQKAGEQTEAEATDNAENVYGEGEAGVSQYELEPKEEDASKESTDESGNTSDDSDTQEDADSETAVNEADAKNSKKSSVFGKKPKKDKKDEKIEELQTKIDELNERHLRDLAEFENFRKRTEREKSQMFEVGAKSIIEKILPAIDSFDRGLASIGEDEKTTPLAEGMSKIYKQLMDSLTDAGLTVIEAVGQEFDPELHNAVMHEENDEFGENTVSEELQKGYKYRDSVVRHSMVKVAN